MCTYTCVCACVRTYARACVRVCVRMRVRVCVRVYVYIVLFISWRRNGSNFRKSEPLQLLEARKRWKSGRSGAGAGVAIRMLEKVLFGEQTTPPVGAGAF